jgi:hypothetical protein
MSRRDHDDEPYRARVPSDVDRPDKIMFGLTARQLVILTVAGLLLYAIWWPLARAVSPLVMVGVGVPYAALAVFLAMSRRDGISLDRWLHAGWRHHRGPHRLVPVDGPIAPAPAWIATRGDTGVPAPMRLPAKGVSTYGVVDLGPDGSAALLAASTVSFSLRSSAEQTALVTGFGRWLNSLDTGVQIVVRARRVDLTVVADAVDDRAAGLPHPALEDAARSHVAFLDELAASRELLHRDVTVAVRDRRSPAHAIARADEAARALGGCEVTAHRLDAAQAAAALAACLNPSAPPAPTGLAASSAVIHAQPLAGES